MTQRILALLKELADDLEAELDSRYPASVRAYPSEEARYQRDMEGVYKARELLRGARIDREAEIIDKFMSELDEMLDTPIDRRPSNTWKCEP